MLSETRREAPETRLYELRASDGGPTWTFRGGGRITDPVPGVGVVYMATFNDELYVLRA
jgi:outer membrane protein assembly factor BamB